jgi:CRISPR system Cascade subunit CasD
MSTLLLRFAAPLQAWGAESKFERRGTGREPTKSGVIGMLAAALGRRRDESVDDLVSLKFGVRIDRPGQITRDFHIAKSQKQTYVTNRYYLEDAVFLVGLEGEKSLLQKLDSAVLSPFFPIFLGRRSCPPTGQISLGMREGTLEEVLCSEPSLVESSTGSPAILVMDADEIGFYRQRDLPISFNPQHRKFAYRYIHTDIISSTTHNPFEGEVE